MTDRDGGGTLRPSERLRRDGNFMAWAARMKAVLVEKDLYEFLEMPKNEVAGSTDKQKNDLKAKSRMVLMIESG